MNQRVPGLQPKVYPLLVECIEAGVAYGLNRAHKHIEHPTREQMAEALEAAIINELMERFNLIESSDDDTDD